MEAKSRFEKEMGNLAEGTNKLLYVGINRLRWYYLLLLLYARILDLHRNGI